MVTLVNVEQWFEDYNDQLVRWVTKKIGDSHFAEDVVQLVFLKIIRLNLTIVDKNILFKAVRNMMIDEIRHSNGENRKKMKLESIGDTYNRSVCSFEDEALGRITIGRVLTDTPEKYRHILTMRHIQGLSYEELADILDIPVGTVKSRLNYAHKVLRARMGHCDLFSG